jgi:membrane-associated phospholipid phosphatase
MSPVKKRMKSASVAVAVLTLSVAALPCRAQSLAPPELPAAPVLDTRPLSGDLRVGGDFSLDDGRRTLGAFPKNLGRTVVGVFSRQSLAPFLVGAAATATAARFDSPTASAITGSCPSCGRTGDFLGGAAIAPTAIALFVAGRFAPQGRFRAASYDLAQALIVTELYTMGLKYGVQRTRPDGSNQLSFPSGHTSAAFTLATVAGRHYGWRVGVPAYLLASGIGLSRIETNKHYLSDVLAGATIGVIVGRTVGRLNDERPEAKRHLAIGPATDPHGTGMGVNVSLAW